MINDYMLNSLATLVSGGSVTVPTYMAMSSSSVISGDLGASVPAEWDRLSGLSSTEDNEVTLTFTRSGVSANGETVQSLWLTDSSSGGNVWAGNLTTSFLHTSNFDLSIEYKLSFTRG